MSIALFVAMSTSRNEAKSRLLNLYDADYRSVQYLKKITKLHHIIMDFPAASPDLNPIEKVWQIVKDNIEKLELSDLTE